MPYCHNCYYGFQNWCANIRSNDGCFNCPNFNNDTLECRCTEVEDTENCPYFKDAYKSEEL